MAIVNEMDDVATLAKNQAQDVNAMIGADERNAVDAAEKKYPDAQVVDVNRDKGVQYFDEGNAGAPAQTAAPAPKPSDAIVQKWAPKADANGDWINNHENKALTNHNSAGGTTLYFGNANGLADAQDAARNHGYSMKPKAAPSTMENPVTGETEDYSGQLASLDKTARDRRRQNASRNDMIVSSGAAALMKNGFAEGQTRAALDKDALGDMNRNLENAGATYRVTGVMMTKDAFGKPQFTISTVERNGKQYVHHRTAEEMYDVAVNATRGLRELRNGTVTTPSVNAKGVPTGDIDEDNMSAIGMFGDVRGVQKAWEQRNADSIAQREATQKKLDLLKTNSDREFRLGLYKMLNEGPNGGKNMSKGDFFKSVLGNKSMTDMFKRGDPVMVKDPKTGEMVQDTDLDGNPKFTELTAEQAAQRMNKYYEDNFKNGVHVDPNMSASDAYTSELGRLLGIDAGIQSGGSATPAPEGSATNADATKADSPAPSVAMSETAKKAADGSSEADLAAEIARRKQAAAATSENNTSKSTASVPGNDVIRPRVVVNSPSVVASPSVENANVENYRTDPASDDEWNAAAKRLGIQGYDKKNGKYVEGRSAYTNADAASRDEKRIFDEVVKQREKIVGGQPWRKTNEEYRAVPQNNAWDKMTPERQNEVEAEDSARRSEVQRQIKEGREEVQRQVQQSERADVMRRRNEADATFEKTLSELEAPANEMDAERDYESRRRAAVRKQIKEGREQVNREVAAAQKSEDDARTGKIVDDMMDRHRMQNTMGELEERLDESVQAGLADKQLKIEMADEDRRIKNIIANGTEEERKKLYEELDFWTNFYNNYAGLKK